MTDEPQPDLDELITLREAAVLAGIKESRLRQYAMELSKTTEQPRLQTRRLGQSRTRPYYTTRRWLDECLASRNPGGRGRPAGQPPAPEPESEP